MWGHDGYITVGAHVYHWTCVEVRVQLSQANFLLPSHDLEVTLGLSGFPCKGLYTLNLLLGSEYIYYTESDGKFVFLKDIK